MFRTLLILPLAMSVSAAAYAQSMQEAMSHALEVRPEVRAGAKARQSAEEQMNAARSGYLPRVDLVTGYGREGTRTPGTRQDEGSFVNMTRSEASLSVQQMVFDGFVTKNEVDRQRSTVNAKAYQLLGTSEKLALNVASVYIDVLKREALERLARDNLARHERLFELIQQRSTQGLGRSVDLEQAEARLAQARNNLITEQTNLEDARVNFQSAVGQSPTALSMPTEVTESMPQSLETARAEMLDNNPLLRSAESDVRAAEAQYQAARSGLYPRVDVEVSRTLNNNLDGTAGVNEDWQAMMRMRYNLYAGGKTTSDIQAKSFQIEEATEIRNDALRVLNEELGLAWNALDNARKQLPIAREYVERSARVRQAYQRQFTLGERTLLDLLDSENELFTASRRLEEVRFIEVSTQYRIKAVMGALLKTHNVVAPMASTPLDNVRVRATLPSGQ